MEQNRGAESAKKKEERRKKRRKLVRDTQKRARGDILVSFCQAKVDRAGDVSRLSYEASPDLQ